MGWSRKPWWWGGWGTYHVAPWGLVDDRGWLLGVGAFEWLWQRDYRYRPEPGTPLYFVTRDGQPSFARPDADVRYRIHHMQPCGDWPDWLRRIDSDPAPDGTMARDRGDKPP